MEMIRFDLNLKELYEQFIKKIIKKEDELQNLKKAVEEKNFISFIISTNDFLYKNELLIKEGKAEESFHRIEILCSFIEDLPFEESVDFIYGKVYVQLEKLIDLNHMGVNDRLIDWVIDHYTICEDIDFSKLFLNHFQEEVYLPSKEAFKKRMMH